MTSARSFAVVGGGITGLAAAWRLSQSAPGARVAVYEAQHRLGGKVWSGSVGGAAVERGPDGFVGRDSVLGRLCDELSLGGDVVGARPAPVAIWSRGRRRLLPPDLLRGLPLRPSALLRSGLLTPRELARAAADSVLPVRGLESDVSVAALVGGRLGHAAVERIADPLFGGIFAGRSERLSADCVLPGLRDRVREHGSLARAMRRSPASPSRGGGGLFAVRGGLERLVAALERRLAERGVELIRGTEVGALLADGGGWRVVAGGREELADAVIITAPAPVAARLVAGGGGTALARIPYADVAVVTLAYPAGTVPADDANGLLVPRAEGRLLRAATWVDKKWPSLATTGTEVIRCSAGGDGDGRPSSMDDAELVTSVRADLREMATIHGSPVDWSVTRWNGALPQYRVGHRDLVEAVRSRLPAGIVVAGAAYDGVGLARCAEQGVAAAEAALRCPGRAPAEVGA